METKLLKCICSFWPEVHPHLIADFFTDFLLRPTVIFKELSPTAISHHKWRLPSSYIYLQSSVLSKKKPTISVNKWELDFSKLTSPKPLHHLSSRLESLNNVWFCFLQNIFGLASRLPGSQHPGPSHIRWLQWCPVFLPAFLPMLHIAELVCSKK